MGFKLKVLENAMWRIKCQKKDHSLRQQTNKNTRKPTSKTWQKQNKMKQNKTEQNKTKQNNEKTKK